MKTGHLQASGNRSTVPAMRASKYAVAATFLLLAACHKHDETNATEAIQAADAKIAKAYPELKHHQFNVKAEDDYRKNRWRVEYYGGTGGIMVYVDRQTGEATIARVDQ